jgi:hypothetical protein
MALIASPDDTKDVGMHECEELLNANTQRSLDEMPLAYVFFDYDRLRWTWRDFCDGETFTEVEHCPFCDKRLDVVIEADRFYWLMIDGEKTIGRAVRRMDGDFEIRFWVCGDCHMVALEDVKVLEAVEERNTC